MNESRFYQFTDSRGTPYYHDPIQNISQWIFPKGSVVIDIKTGSEITNAPRNLPSPPKSKNSQGSDLNRGIPLNSTSTSSPSSRTSFRKSRIRKNTNLSSTLTLATVKELEDNAYFPPLLLMDRSRNFDYSYLANLLLFRKKALKAFSKITSTEYEHFLSYDDNMSPSSVPLLKNTEPVYSKQAQDMFKFILDFCSPTSLLKPSQILQYITDSNASVMKEELFAQLAKVLRSNPDLEFRARGWQLLCVSCSIYQIDSKGETAPLVDLIRWLSARDSRDTNRRIANKALISYIRFTGEHPLTYTAEEIDVWTTQDNTLGFKPFGSSIFEQLWAQRAAFPNCPIPIILDKICKGVIAKGAEKMEGIFRLQGRQKDVDALIEAFNRLEDPIPNASLLDLSTTVKKWLALLQAPVVPPDLLTELMSSKEYVSFANRLPRANKDTLMYFIGFLKTIAKYSEITNMSENALGLTFGTAILRSPSKEPQMIHKTAEVGKNFVVTLLNDWDFSPIYPLPETAYTL